MRLIDADKTAGKLERLYKTLHGEARRAASKAIDIVADADEVDAESVRHGMWIDANPHNEDDPRMICSVCGNVQTPLIMWDYCPLCGAKMDLYAK